MLCPNEVHLPLQLCPASLYLCGRTAFSVNRSDVRSGASANSRLAGFSVVVLHTSRACDTGESKLPTYESASCRCGVVCLLRPDHRASGLFKAFHTVHRPPCFSKG